MSFQLSATVAKASEVKRALEGQRDQRLKEFQAAADQGAPTVDRGSAEVDDLAAAGIAAAEAAAKKLQGNRFQVTVSGHRDAGGGSAEQAPPSTSISVAVVAFP